MDKKQASEFADNVSEKLTESLKEAFGKLEHQEDVQALKQSAKEVADTATEFIRKYPLQSVIGAAIIGFAVGSLLNKRKSL